MNTKKQLPVKVSRWYCYDWDLTKDIGEVFGQAGYIRTTYAYTPYGAVTEEGDVTQPLQWSSEYADPELGLVYYNYRYYNPTDGRWNRRDPMGLEITADKSQCAIHVVLKLAFIDKRKKASTEADVAQIKKEIEEVWNSDPQAARKGCCTIEIHVNTLVVPKGSKVPGDYFLVYLHSNASILETIPVYGGRRREDYRSKIEGKDLFPPSLSTIPPDGYKTATLDHGRRIAQIHPQNVYYPEVGHLNVERYVFHNQGKRTYTYAHEAGHIMMLPDEYVGGYRMDDYQGDLMADSESSQLRKDYFEKITRDVPCPCNAS